MYYIREIHQFEQEISHSKFIALMHPIEKKEDISLYIERIKEQYPKANHYCYAALIGHHQEVQLASDDGEPQRTAGVPILDVLKHHNLTNVLCVVVRYFGGIKLGAGGLIRAYSKSCSGAIESSIKYRRAIFASYQIDFGYHLMDQIEKLLTNKALIHQKTFLEYVRYDIVFDQVDDTYLREFSHLLIAYKKMNPKTYYIHI